ncbi:MAG: DUF2007 domain-containing protein [Chitinophagaceae bacterium]|jgi:DNA-directed RNA polymerase subunit RPC12/RpoP|nr:DUF2007 domain-containing protein [Chitinophagaceae bacterium]
MDDKLIPLQSYGNYVEANIVLGRLQSDGVDCWLQDENTFTINPVIGNAIGGIRLVVPQSQEQRAKELMGEYLAEQREVIVCPKCHSHNIEFVSTPKKASNWLGSLLGFFLASYAIPVEKVYHCFDCGFEFENPAL